MNRRRNICLSRKSRPKLISRFPFVRAVLASGSLSKGYMDEKSDIDFFIITAPHRLWIARTLLVLYKRLFLGGSHKHFCVNYFVDEDHLEIEEKNLFTATELATVLPLYGAEQYKSLIKTNGWVRDFFPNYIARSTENVSSVNHNRNQKGPGKINKRVLCTEYRIVFQKTYDEAVEKTLRKRIFKN